MSSRVKVPSKRKNENGSLSLNKAKQVKRDGPRTTLMPISERKKAIVGLKDEPMLRILCKDSKTGEEKMLNFRNLPYSQLDWNNPEHIAKINAWRNQIYGRAGMRAKDVTIWLPDEELWFELYYHLSIAMAQARGMLIPKSREVLNSFNATFAPLADGDFDGEKLPGDRTPNAFASKLNRMCLNLRNRLCASVYSKPGDSFVPTITLDMLDEYKKMKLDLAMKGIYGESAYSDDLEEWKYFLSHLPGDTSHLHRKAPKKAIKEEYATPPLSSYGEADELPNSQSLSQSPAPEVYVRNREEALKHYPNLTEEDIDAAEALLCLSKYPVVFSETKCYMRKGQDTPFDKYWD